MLENFIPSTPGQAFRSKSKRHPWQRPPEINDPEEALFMHIERLSRDDIQDNILDVITAGIPIVVLTAMTTQWAVSKGLHTIDVSLIVAPVIHEYLISIAKQAGIPYQEFAEEGERDVSQQAMEIAKRQVLQVIRDTPDKDAGTDLLEEMTESVGQPIDQDSEPPMEETPDDMQRLDEVSEPPKTMGRGLARRQR